MAGGLMLVALSAVAFFAKSQNTETSLLMRNVEALARWEGDSGDNDEFKYRIDKDPCNITITGSMNLGKIGQWMARLGLGEPSVGMTIDLTSFTCIYTRGGSYRLGEDVRCADLI